MYLIVLFIFSSMLILGLSAMIIGIMFMLSNIQNLRREKNLYKIESHALNFFHSFLLAIIGAFMIIIYLIKTI